MSSTKAFQWIDGWAGTIKLVGGTPSVYLGITRMDASDGAVTTQLIQEVGGATIQPSISLTSGAHLNWTNMACYPSGPGCVIDGELTTSFTGSSQFLTGRFIFSSGIKILSSLQIVAAAANGVIELQSCTVQTLSQVAYTVPFST